MLLLKRVIRLRCKVGRRQLSVANVLCLVWLIVLLVLVVARIRGELRGSSASNSLTHRCRQKENMYSRECRYLRRSHVTLYPAPTPPLVTPTPSQRQTVRRRYLADKCNATQQQQQLGQQSQQSSSRFSKLYNLGQSSTSAAAAGPVTSLYVDDSRRFIYCLVEGSAHLSWSRILLHETDRLKRYKTRVGHVGSQTANQWRTDGLGPLVPLDTDHFLQEQIDERLSSYFKFMFVRHPFERLAAAFQDRLNRSKETFAMQTFRDKLAQLQQQQQPSVEGQQTNTGDFNWPGNGSLTYVKRAITFQDLVTYMLDNRTDLLDGSTLNANLLPQHAVCQPCSINYDYIGHYETLSEDAYEVLNIVGISKVRFPDPRRDGSGFVQTVQTASTMISGLKSDEQRRLREFYALDFSLFGYI